MFPDSVIDASLIQAYRDTHYHVHGPQPFTLKVGEVSGELARAHRRCGVACSAFVTACNPYSRALAEVENTRLQAELLQRLADRGWAHWPGRGQHPSNGWPAEPSVLVFGLSPDAARELGRSLMQNAIVWSGADAEPRLILLR